MEAKEILTNKSFCVLPWTGFELEPNGNVKNCIISTEKLGNIEQQDIESILLGEKNTALKEQMIRDLKPNNCSGCHLQEKEEQIYLV
jgi:radical SAM protein with 4Fe4S-binding SPASM domain